MKLSRELLSIVEAKNHLGETVYTTFPSWKSNCKKQYPDVWFDGDIDICNAFVGTKPYKRGETKAIGEWDGNEGCIFIKEDVEYAKKLVRGEKSGPGLMNKINQFVTWKLFFNKDKTRFLPADQAVKQLKQAGFSEDQIHKIRDIAAEAGLAAVEYIKTKYPDQVPEKYVASMASSFQVYDLYLNVGEDIRVEFQTKFQKLFDLKMAKAKDALKLKESVDKEMSIGSTVHVTDGGEFQDSVGEVVRFSSDKKFVVVKLFADKKEHTFHFDDLTLEVEGNDVDEDDEEKDEDTFYVAIYDEDEQTHWIGEVSKSNGTKWHETTYSGKADYRWGQSYMSYLTPSDVMSWINKDYGRGYDIAGPFSTPEEAEEHVDQNFGGQVNEAVAYTDFDDWKQAVLNSYPAQAKKIKFKGRFEGGKHTISAEVPNEDRSYGVWDGDKDKGVVLSEGALKSVKALASKIGKWLISPAMSKEHIQSIKDLVDAEIKLEQSREDVMWSRIMKEMSDSQLQLISKNREIKAVARAAALKEISVRNSESMSEGAIWDAIKKNVNHQANKIKASDKMRARADDVDSLKGAESITDASKYPKAKQELARKAAKAERDVARYQRFATTGKAFKAAVANEGVDGETPTSFNDDDWYEYDPKTLIIKSRNGPTYYRAEQTLDNGNKVVRGMKAKRLGLKKE